MANTRKTILTLHRWLGLGSGLVVFIVSITGCLYAFQEEIFDAVHQDVLYVAQPQQQALPMSVLYEKAQEALGPEYPITAAITHKDPVKTWSFEALKEDHEALTYFGQHVYFQTAYLNPYTGEVAGVMDSKYEFFELVKYLHWSLWLSTEVGQPIVGVSTLIFLVMLISGLVLWWPGSKSKKAFKQRFTVKWGAKFKRLNYDLHNVPGFYISMISAIVALTGLVMAFRWVLALVYFMASGGETAETPPVKLEAPVVQTASTPLDEVFTSSRSLYPEAATIGLFGAAQDSLVLAYVKVQDDVYYESHNLLYERATGKPLTAQHHEDRNAGEKLLYMNYDIHVGAILGMPGKILAFLASLVCSSLPVTGFLIWYGKRGKQKKHPRVAAPARVSA
ncbi:PepSY-associated TM helix domain-containing protein [Pontibacter actiniarum]|uniref:PepSY domain-containing protein n=1 Tax=Pontibacter actiniarum TaxID=323450 RepID=A0A1X9YMD5_9BACT|nr:PepSY-associated TM helix domain-containing protein [Pontibacter actiniarum]ARS34035.1 hypothetical protein CA264_00480 [Pontibacter actiniarum]